MSQLVKKSVKIIDLPLRLESVKVLPVASWSGIANTADGIGASRRVPPIFAGLPMSGGGVGITIAIPLGEADGLLELPATAGDIPNKVKITSRPNFFISVLPKQHVSPSNHPKKVRVKFDTESYPILSHKNHTVCELSHSFRLCSNKVGLNRNQQLFFEPNR